MNIRNEGVDDSRKLPDNKNRNYQKLSEANTRRRYKSMIDKAIEFATRAHRGQFRKGTRRPYIVHPIEVGDIVCSMTKDEEVISAAYLHDTIEAVSYTHLDVYKRQGSGNSGCGIRKQSGKQRIGTKSGSTESDSRYAGCGY